MSKYSELQNEICDAAAKQMEGNKGFRGVCVDLFKQGSELDCDEKINTLGKEKAVQKLVDDTMYWDGLWI